MIEGYIESRSTATRDFAIRAAVRKFIKTIKYRDGILVDDFLYDPHEYFVTLVIHIPDGTYGQAGSETFVTQMDRLKDELRRHIVESLQNKQLNDSYTPRLCLHCIYHTNWLFIRDREAGGSDDA